MKGTDSQVKFANFLRMHICWIGCSTNHSTLFIILKGQKKTLVFFLVYYINNVFNKHS